MLTVWQSLPVYPLGELPEYIYDDEPEMARTLIAKRALMATYEDADNCPRDAIIALLADLRELCQHLGVSYDALDSAARMLIENPTASVGCEKPAPCNSLGICKKPPTPPENPMTKDSTKFDRHGKLVRLATDIVSHRLTPMDITQDHLTMLGVIGTTGMDWPYVHEIAAQVLCRHVEQGMEDAP